MLYFESYGWKWETPPANSWEGYFAKYIKLNNYDLRLNPFYLLYSGRVDSGSLYNVGSNGYYWSSTAYNASHAYRLLFSSSSVGPSYNYNRYGGFSIRCLAR